MHVINIPREIGGGVLSADEVTLHDVYRDDMQPRRSACINVFRLVGFNDAVVLGGARTCEKIACNRAAAADAERHTSPSV